MRDVIGIFLMALTLHALHIFLRGFQRLFEFLGIEIGLFLVPILKNRILLGLLLDPLELLTDLIFQRFDFLFFELSL